MATSGEPSKQKVILCGIVVAVFAVAVNFVVQRRSLPPPPPESGKAILKNIVSGTDAGDADLKELDRQNAKL